MTDIRFIHIQQYGSGITGGIPGRAYLAYLFSGLLEGELLTNRSRRLTPAGDSLWVIQFAFFPVSAFASFNY